MESESDTENEQLQHDILQINEVLGQGEDEGDDSDWVLEKDDTKEADDDDDDDHSIVFIPDDGFVETNEGGSHQSSLFQQHIDHTSTSEESSLEHLLLINQQSQRNLQELLIRVTEELERNHDEQAKVSRNPSNREEKNLDLSIMGLFRDYMELLQDGAGRKPPRNEDTKQRMSGDRSGPFELKQTKWSETQREKLLEAVRTEGLKRAMQPLLNRREILEMKMDRLSVPEMLEKVYQDIENNKEELIKTESIPTEQLLGDRFREVDWDTTANVYLDAERSAKECQLQWQNLLHPSISRNKWTAREKEELICVASKHEARDWAAIAEELGTGRTALQCLRVFQLQDKSFVRPTFTDEEDVLLQELAQQLRVGKYIPFQKVAYYMEGHTQLQVLYRWMRKVDPDIKTGKFTQEEEDKLNKLITVYGAKNWARLAELMPGRTQFQIRHKWTTVLSPFIKSGPWDYQETMEFLQKVKEQGVGNWSRIAAALQKNPREKERTSYHLLQRFKNLVTSYMTWRNNSSNLDWKVEGGIEEDLLGGQLADKLLAYIPLKQKAKEEAKAQRLARKEERSRKEFEGVKKKKRRRKLKAESSSEEEENDGDRDDDNDDDDDDYDNDELDVNEEVNRSRAQFLSQEEYLTARQKALAQRKELQQETALVRQQHLASALEIKRREKRQRHANKQLMSKLDSMSKDIVSDEEEEGIEDVDPYDARNEEDDEAETHEGADTSSGTLEGRNIVSNHLSGWQQRLKDREAAQKETHFPRNNQSANYNPDGKGLPPWMEKLKERVTPERKTAGRRAYSDLDLELIKAVDPMWICRGKGSGRHSSQQLGMQKRTRQEKLTLNDQKMMFKLLLKVLDVDIEYASTKVRFSLHVPSEAYAAPEKTGSVIQTTQGTSEEAASVCQKAGTTNAQGVASDSMATTRSSQLTSGGCEMIRDVGREMRSQTATGFTQPLTIGRQEVISGLPGVTNGPQPIAGGLPVVTVGSQVMTAGARAMATSLFPVQNILLGMNTRPHIFTSGHQGVTIGLQTVITSQPSLFTAPLGVTSGPHVVRTVGSHSHNGGLQAVTSGPQIQASYLQAVATCPTAVASEPQVVASDLHTVAGNFQAGASGPQSLTYVQQAVASVPQADAIGPQEVTSVLQAVASSPPAVTRLLQAVASGTPAKTSGLQAVASGPPAVTNFLQAEASSPQAVTSGQQAVAIGPPAVTSTPQAESSSTQALTSGPQDVTNVPQAVTSGPQAVTTFPPAVASDPQVVTNVQQAVASGLQAVGSGLQARASGSPAVTSVLQAVASSPQTVTSGPQAVTNGPQAVASVPQAVASGLQAVTSGLQAVTSGSPALTSDPQAVASSPQAVASSPQAVASVPQAVASGLQAVTSGLQAVASGSPALTSDPQAVASSPQAVTSGPQAVTNGPQAVASVPQAVASGLQAVTSGSRALTSDPQAVASSPRAVTSGPQAVTSGPQAVTNVPQAIDSGLQAVASGLQKETNNMQSVTSGMKSHDISTKTLSETVPPSNIQPEKAKKDDTTSKGSSQRKRRGRSLSVRQELELQRRKLAEKVSSSPKSMFQKNSNLTPPLSSPRNQVSLHNSTPTGFRSPIHVQSGFNQNLAVAGGRNAGQSQRQHASLPQNTNTATMSPALTQRKLTLITNPLAEGASGTLQSRGRLLPIGNLAQVSKTAHGTSEADSNQYLMFRDNQSGQVLLSQLPSGLVQKQPRGLTSSQSQVMSIPPVAQNQESPRVLQSLLSGVAQQQEQVVSQPAAVPNPITSVNTQLQVHLLPTMTAPSPNQFSASSTLQAISQMMNPVANGTCVDPPASQDTRMKSGTLPQSLPLLKSHTAQTHSGTISQTLSLAAAHQNVGSLARQEQHTTSSNAGNPPTTVNNSQEEPQCKQSHPAPFCSESAPKQLDVQQFPSVVQHTPDLSNANLKSLSLPNGTKLVITMDQFRSLEKGKLGDVTGHILTPMPRSHEKKKKKKSKKDKRHRAKLKKKHAKLKKHGKQSKEQSQGTSTDPPQKDPPPVKKRKLHTKDISLLPPNIATIQALKSLLLDRKNLEERRSKFMSELEKRLIKSKKADGKQTAHFSGYLEGRKTAQEKTRETVDSPATLPSVAPESSNNQSESVISNSQGQLNDVAPSGSITNDSEGPGKATSPQELVEEHLSSLKKTDSYKLLQRRFLSLLLWPGLLSSTRIKGMISVNLGDRSSYDDMPRKPKQAKKERKAHGGQQPVLKKQGDRSIRKNTAGVSNPTCQVTLESQRASIGLLQDQSVVEIGGSKTHCNEDQYSANQAPSTSGHFVVKCPATDSVGVVHGNEAGSTNNDQGVLARGKKRKAEDSPSSFGPHDDDDQQRMSEEGEDDSGIPQNRKRKVSESNYTDAMMALAALQNFDI